MLGTGGTLLAGKIKGELTGRMIGGTRVSYGRADHRFGFALLTRAADGWRADFHDLAGASLFRCQIAGPSRLQLIRGNWRHSSSSLAAGQTALSVVLQPFSACPASRPSRRVTRLTLSPTANCDRSTVAWPAASAGHREHSEKEVAKMSQFLGSLFRRVGGLAPRGARHQAHCAGCRAASGARLDLSQGDFPRWHWRAAMSSSRAR